MCRSPRSRSPASGMCWTSAQYQALLDTIEQARGVIDARVVWNINSTARGGGVAELLQSLIAYGRGAGFDARWMVIAGEPEFFALTKRHPQPPAWRRGRRRPARRPRARAVRTRLRRECARSSRPSCARATWCSCTTRRPPASFALCVTSARASCGAATWASTCPTNSARRHGRSSFPTSPTPRRMSSRARASSGRTSTPRGSSSSRPRSTCSRRRTRRCSRAPSRQSSRPPDCATSASAARPIFTRTDGAPGRVERRAELVEEAPLPAEARLLTQVSRWDRLKDPAGVVEAFAGHDRRRDRGASRARRPRRHGRRGRPGRQRGARARSRSARAAAGGRPRAGPPGAAAHGRRRGERSDRQRAPAPLRRDRARRASRRASA